MSIIYILKTVQIGLPPRGANLNPSLPLLLEARGDLISYSLSDSSLIISFRRIDNILDLLVLLKLYNYLILLLVDNKG